MHRVWFPRLGETVGIPDIGERGIVTSVTLESNYPISFFVRLHGTGDFQAFGLDALSKLPKPTQPFVHMRRRGDWRQRKDNNDAA